MQENNQENIKKVGILTFYKAYNYGAVLQAYALQVYLKSLGYDVYIIDYAPSYLLAYNKLISIRRFLTKNIFRLFYLFIVEILSIKYRKERNRKFSSFIKNNLLITSKESIGILDYIFIGSDQVWNIKMTKGFDPYYWAHFKTRAIVASYAASIGDDNSIFDGKDDLLRDNLKNFSFVSIREEAAKERMQQLTSKPVSFCLDPTLLLGKEWWQSLSLPKRDCNYVLLYLTKYDEAAIRLAKEISTQRNLKIIELKILSSWKYRCNKYQTASPLEFLQLFKHASYIITTSFHGTVFSILYERKFLLMHTRRVNKRSESLLSSLGLSDRMHVDIQSIDKEINWNQVHSRLKELQSESYNYINNVLKV